MDDSLNLNLSTNSYQFNDYNSSFNNNSFLDENTNTSNIIETNDIHEEVKNEEIIEEKNQINDNNRIPINEILIKYSDYTITQNEFEIYKDKFFETSHFIVYQCKCKNNESSALILNKVTYNSNDVDSLLSQLVELKQKKINILNQMKYLSYIEQSDELVIFFDKPIKSHYNESSDKYIICLKVINMLIDLHNNNQSIYSINPSQLLFTYDNELTLILPYNEYLTFMPNNKEAMLYYNSTEEVIGISNKDELPKDIWKYGCFLLDIFYPKWKSTIVLSELQSNLKEYIPIKIPKEIPKELWNLLCLCLNPYKDVRISAQEVKSYLVKIIISIPDCNKNNELKSLLIEDSPSHINIEENSNQHTVMNKFCEFHRENEANLYCVKCLSFICSECESKNHQPHKDSIFTFKDFIKLVNERTELFKSKFDKYLVETNIIEQKEIIYEIVNKNISDIEQLYSIQLDKLNKQFTYLHELIDKLKETEVSHLLTYKDFFNNKIGLLKDNYDNILNKISNINKILNDRIDKLSTFDSQSRSNQENTIVNVVKEDNIIVEIKKDIIKSISQVYKEKDYISLQKRYFEQFISHYRDTKINDIVKLLEIKTESLNKKYKEENKDTYYTSLINEFESSSQIASKLHFNPLYRELFLPISNTDNLYKYSFDIGQFTILSPDFGSIALKRFPNYSKHLQIDKTLYINGGFDEESKSMLKDTIVYNIETETLSQLPDMIYSHSAHSIIFLPCPANQIIVVSGSGLSKCESYSFENQSWSELPDINTPRQNTCLFYFNKQYLYSFGGAYWNESTKSFDYLDTIERLDLGFGAIKGSNKWEEVHYIIKGIISSNLKRSVISVLPFDNSTVLLIGGSIGYNKYSQDCYTFNFESKAVQVEPNIKVPTNTCFPNKWIYSYSNKAYQFDNQGNVYEFDIENKQFTLINPLTVQKD